MYYIAKTINHGL